jgi:tetratricopeptide (TPR) repeat protein
MEPLRNRVRSLSRLHVFFLFLLTTFALASCTVQLEPAYNEKIVEELETLTMETEALFAQITDGVPATGYEKRENTYAALATRAATIKLYAESRPAPSGKIADFFSNLFAPATPPGIGEPAATAEDDRKTGSIEEDRYANATAGYMEDYLRNLKRLADRDRKNVESILGSLGSFEAAQKAYQAALEQYTKAYADWVTGRGPKPSALQPEPVAPTGSVSANFVERRRIVMEDILRDALFYERDVLNRNR